MRKKSLFVLLCVALFLSSSVPFMVHAAAWWDTDWDYKVKITIDQTKVDADLTDFPVLVYLNSARINWVHVQDDLDDLRFLDSTEMTVLKAELEKYALNSEAWIWVKVPAVSGSVDTVIYVYYGNAGAASAWDPENVWGADAVMVQHMKSATNSTILDSTANNNDGTLSSVGTFGASTGASYTTVPADQVYGSIFTSPADANGVVNSFTWYGRTTSGTGNSKAILVDSSLNIVAVSDVTATTATAGTWTNTFSSPPTIAANTQYWLMMVFDVSTRFYYGTGATNQGALDTTNSYTTPTNPTDATNNDNKYRIYATYTSTLFQTGGGKIDSALAFDGLNDYGSVIDSASLDTVVCFEAWVNPVAYVSSGTSAHIIISKHTGYRHGLYVGYNVNPNVFLAYSYDGVTESYSQWTIPDYTAWYHVVSQWNSITGKAELYVDGELKAEGAVITGTSGNNAEPLRIGGGVTASRWSTVIIDEARVYSTAKSAEWIKATYNSGADTLLTISAEYTRTPLTIYFNAGVNKLYINGTQITNGTILQITPDTNVNATATTKLNHLFFKHLLTGLAPNFTTPYLFNMTTSYTLWTYAVVSGVAGASSGALIFTGLLCLIVLIPFIWRRRS